MKTIIVSIITLLLTTSSLLGQRPIGENEKGYAANDVEAQIYRLAHVTPISETYTTGKDFISSSAYFHIQGLAVFKDGCECRSNFTKWEPDGFYCGVEI